MTELGDVDADAERPSGTIDGQEGAPGLRVDCEVARAGHVPMMPQK